MTTPCPKCGKPHLAYNGRPGCKGHKAGQPDTPCSKEPIKGLNVCRTHGGSAPQSKRAAANRIAAAEAAKLRVTLGGEPTDTEPLEGIHMVICWSRTHMDWYRYQLQRYLPDALVWGDAKVKRSDLQGLTVEEQAQVNLWLQLYNREREFFLKACTIAVQHGLAEREIRLEEQQGALFAEIIRAILADLELSPDQQSRALQVVPDHLSRAAALN